MIRNLCIISYILTFSVTILAVLLLGYWLPDHGYLTSAFIVGCFLIFWDMYDTFWLHTFPSQCAKYVLGKKVHESYIGAALVALAIILPVIPP